MGSLIGGAILALILSAGIFIAISILSEVFDDYP